MAYTLVSIPFVLLFIKAVTWVRYGIDVPVSDDWWTYLGRTFGSFDPVWLFSASHDTLSPVGATLESIASITIGGNTVVYQLVTMLAVLGGMLAMQWRLLRWAFQDLLHTAIVFSLCSLMLLSRGYWGGVNTAYVQVLPLVAIMAAIVVALRPGDPSRWAMLAGLALGLLSGFSYISGAFGALVAGGTMVAIGFAGHIKSRRRVRQVGMGLLAAGLIAAAAQLMATRVMQGESMVGNQLTMPWEPDFWYFMLGKVGASLGLDPWHQPKLAMALSLAAVAMGVVAVAWALRSLRHKPSEPPRADVVAVVTLAVAATIFVYLLLISAARTYAWPLPERYGPTDVFQTGFHRFHFYWVTVLWPWVGAVALSLILAWTRRRSAWIRSSGLVVAVTAPLLVVLLAVRSGGFDYDWYFGVWSTTRVETYRCLLNTMQGDDEQYCGLPPDIINYARSVDATWTRILMTMPMPTADLLFALDDPSSGSVQILNTDVTKRGGGLSLQAADDVQILVSVADDEAMQQCGTLEIRADLRPEGPDDAQVFYLRPGDELYSPDRMAGAAIVQAGTGWATTTHLLTSEEGFANTIRYDPVFTAQEVEVASLEIYCRLPAH